jgi:hypothetical protein
VLKSDIITTEVVVVLAAAQLAAVWKINQPANGEGDDDRTDCIYIDLLLPVWVEFFF